MSEQALPSAKIPSATYRLQFNAQFTFSAAREIVAYLHELGISDLYASSYLQAKEGSIHGYDVVDQTVLNREVGNEETYQGLVEELQRFGMGQILDFVPNHMCIESTENTRWMDVLENGQSSPYAYFFDIDGQPVKNELTGKVVLHFLPPYCPDDNRIERVWLDLHANVTRNHRCSTSSMRSGRSSC